SASENLSSNADAGALRRGAGVVGGPAGVVARGGWAGVCRTSCRPAYCDLFPPGSTVPSHSHMRRAGLLLAAMRRRASGPAKALGALSPEHSGCAHRWLPTSSRWRRDYSIDCCITTYYIVIYDVEEPRNRPRCDHVSD